MVINMNWFKKHKYVGWQWAMTISIVAIVAGLTAYVLSSLASSVPANLSYPTGCPPNPSSCCGNCPLNGIVFIVQNFWYILTICISVGVILIIGLALFGGKPHGK